MAKMTPEKKQQIEVAADRVAEDTAHEFAVHVMDKLGDWDFYGECGDDLTDDQYEKACHLVVRKIAEKWIASLQKKGSI